MQMHIALVSAQTRVSTLVRLKMPTARVYLLLIIPKMEIDRISNRDEQVSYATNFRNDFSSAFPVSLQNGQRSLSLPFSRLLIGTVGISLVDLFARQIQEVDKSRI
jgi:hypothetical protein